MARWSGQATRDSGRTEGDTDMELIHVHAGTFKDASPSRRQTAVAIAFALVVAVGAVAFAVSSRPASSGGGLTPEQVVIQAEVADRLAAGAARSSSNVDQIVIRAEVADRLAADAARSGLTPEQVIIQAEVADRLAGFKTK
jgi:hypothetical protein